MKFNQYDTVRRLAIHRIDDEAITAKGLAKPKPGGIATIVELFGEPTLGFELECCDENGPTIWLASLEPSEITLEKLNTG